MTKSKSNEAWVEDLLAIVAKRPVVLVKLEEDEVQGLKIKSDRARQFSLARFHDAAKGISTPCVCLFFAEKPRPFGGQLDLPAAYVAVFKSKAAITTFMSRLAFRRGVEIQPSTPTDVASLFIGGKFERYMRERLESTVPFVPLGPKVSVELVKKLLAIKSNRGPLRILAGGLSKPPAASNERLQVDALKTALSAFGLSEDAPAATMNLTRGFKTGMTRLNVLEDAVIEHDARTVPGYEFISSTVRGQATFRKGEQTLEVYTANRRNLEEAFGVDLIYLNLFHRSVVLVQYKMLEPQGGSETPDWVYREDAHLAKQLKTMRLFKAKASRPDGFRLSNEAFYFKFVRRQESSASTNLLLPLGHFEGILKDSNARTKAGNLRVSYVALNGRYMRQTAFVDLLRAGYIGSDAWTTEHLQTLIRKVVSGDDSLVIAVQRETRPQEVEQDHRRRLRELGVEDPVE